MFRFKINNVKLLVFVGYRFDEPFEMHTIKEVDYLLSSNIKSGFVIYAKNSNNEDRYDFQYLDKDGYHVTIEGVSRFGYIKDKMVTVLLRNGLSFKVILEILEEFDEEEYGSFELNLARKKVLLKK